MAEKQHLNVVFIGHVDHGKSTTVGRVLLERCHKMQPLMSGLAIK